MAQKKTETAETTRSHLDQLFAPIMNSATKADQKISQLQANCISAQAELKRLKENKCPICGRLRPPDDQCYPCSVDAMPSTDKLIYRRGLIDAFQAVAVSAEKGARGVASGHYLAALASRVERHKIDPDRRAAARAAADETQQGGDFGPLLASDPCGSATEKIFELTPENL